MKHLVQRILVSAALLLGLSLATGGLVFAAPAPDPTTPAPTQSGPVDVLDSGACTGTNLCSDTTGVFGLIKNIINVMLMVAGIITVIVIIIGGISYTTSAGDQSKVTQAKNTILYAVIGLVVTILAYAIVNFVIGKI